MTLQTSGQLSYDIYKPIVQANVFQIKVFGKGRICKHSLIRKESNVVKMFHSVKNSKVVCVTSFHRNYTETPWRRGVQLERGREGGTPMYEGGKLTGGD